MVTSPAPTRSTRDLLLDTAERLYAERGLAQVSNRQIAEAAGQANNSVVAYHVGTKADLVAALASAVVPFLTVPFERSAQRRGLLGSTWRLLAAPAATRPERLVSAAVRRPLPSAAIGVLGVAATFGLLLAAGPPTQWFS